MKKEIFKSWGNVLPVFVAVALAIAIGCSQQTSRKDVASAREKLDKEQQKTTETQREAQREIADAQQKAQEHTAAKPVTPDQTTPTRDEKNLAKVQESTAEKIAKQTEKEREAAANVADKEQ